MRKFLLTINAQIKGIILVLKPHLLFGFTQKWNLFFSNTISLSKWIANQEKIKFNDFFKFKRDYNNREKLYEFVIESQNLKTKPIDYLEFGVCGGNSFFWWMENQGNLNSRFYGFDTFEGLPENWGIGFKKGDMAADIPLLNDSRGKFYKGLFQETLPGFLSEIKENTNTKVIHMDADLFSSTLYALTAMAPLMKVGDIILFDEFNVPNHEYFAYTCFTDSYYIKTKLIGAVNNYYQTAFVITVVPGRSS